MNLISKLFDFYNYLNFQNIAFKNSFHYIFYSPRLPTYLPSPCYARSTQGKDYTPPLVILSWATLSNSPHVNMCSFISFSTVFLEVFLGRPGFLIPSGVHRSAILVMLSVGFLSTCPIHCHLRLINIDLMSSLFAFKWSSTFDILLGKKINLIFVRHPLWKLESLSMSPSPFYVYKVSIAILCKRSEVNVFHCTAFFKEAGWSTNWLIDRSSITLILDIFFLILTFSNK